MQKKPTDFLRIGHRGSAAESPENTLASFRRALRQGAQMIECDLQLTADGHVVLIHDWEVDRTTDGRGAVSQLTLEQLLDLDAGSWKGPEFKGERVPTLEEGLDAVLPDATMNLELKCRGSAQDARRLAESAMAAVVDRQALDRVIFSSFDPQAVLALREVSPEAPLGILWAHAPYEAAFEFAGPLAAVALHPRVGTFDAATVQEAHARGLAVNVWTVNEPDEILECARMGVDGIISDHPDRLREAQALVGSESS